MTCDLCELANLEKTLHMEQVCQECWEKFNTWVENKRWTAEWFEHD